MFDKRMLSKLTMSGGSQEYMKKLLLDIDIENIPAKLGGRYTGYNPPYSFNLSVDGPFFYPGCPYMTARNALPAEINENQNALVSEADSDATASVSPLHDAAAAAEEEDCRTEAGEQADSGPSLSEAEAAARGSSVSFAADDSSKGTASSPLGRRSRGFKMKHIMRLFSPSHQSDSSSKGSPSLLPPSHSPLPSPSPSQSQSQQRQWQRQSGGAGTATPRENRAVPSYRSDLDTATTLPSDGSSDPAWSHKSGLRRPSRSHRRESSLSSLESSALPYSSPIAGEFGQHSQRQQRSSRGSSQRTSSRVHSPSEKRRSSSRRHSQHSSSREEKEDRSPANTVTVGLSGRDSRDRDPVQQPPRAKVKAPKPGESIEHWKARVNYSSVDAAASDDLHRQCYSCFASIDNGNSTDGGSLWICF